MIFDVDVMLGHIIILLNIVFSNYFSNLLALEELL